MDPFTIATGLSGFLSLAIEITKILGGYVSDVKSAPEDAHNLLVEVTALCHVLDQLINFLRTDAKGDFAPTSALYIVIMSCQENIQALYKKLEKLQVRSDKKVVGIIKRVIEWPLKKEDCQSTLATLHRFAQTFQFSLTVSNCELLSKTSAVVLSTFEDRQKQIETTIESFKAMNLPAIEDLLLASKKQSETYNDVFQTIQTAMNTQDKIWVTLQDMKGQTNDQEMEDLLQWISPNGPQKRHRDVKLKRLANTGNWFLEMESFRNWRDNDDEKSNLLGCYGIPGAGKTLISSLVIDHLSSKFSEENVCVAFAYCDYRDKPEQQSVERMIGGILKHALAVVRSIPEEVYKHLLQQKKQKKCLDLEEMLQALSKTLWNFDKTYICIDALDECDEKQRGKLVQSLKQLAAGTFDEQEPLAVKLFFTGRPQMKDFINSHPSMLSTLPVSIKLEASEGDIIAFINHRIQEDTKVTMEEDLKNEIITNIVATS